MSEPILTAEQRRAFADVVRWAKKVAFPADGIDPRILIALDERLRWLEGERERLVAELDSPHLLESLAALEHERWAGWEAYRREKVQSTHPSGEAYVHRWRRLENTLYAQLTETDKESDRIEVRKRLAMIQRSLRGWMEDTDNQSQGIHMSGPNVADTAERTDQ